MRILVRGGCGFIGSNLVRLLVRNGDFVINVDKLTYAGNLASLSDLADHESLVFEHADISDAARLKANFETYRPDAVIHLAAESHVDRSIDGPEAFVQTNLVGTCSLLQNALEYWRGLSVEARSGFRFLHVSTDEVYGSLDPDAVPFSETTPYDPHSPYSASKAGADHLVRAWGDTYGLPILVTNCSNNYGPYQFPEKLIPVVILKCLRREVIPVYGKGENLRDWLYVEDHVEALRQVLAKGDVGETYNIGGENEQRNIDLVHTICRILDEMKPLADGSYRDLICFVPDRPGHDMRYAIDASKIHQALGWEPKESFTSGFRKTIQWYLENENWWQPILTGDYKLERMGHSGN